MQVTGFLAVLLCVAFVPPNSVDPWGRILLLGTVLAICSLASAGAVMGTRSVFVRLLCGAGVVVGGVLAIELAEEHAHASGFRFEQVTLIELFALALWAIIQGPFWVARFVLGARVISGPVVPAESHAQSQYGIRQLMFLTLTVAVTLGAFRLMVPQQTLQEVRQIAIATWMFLVAIAGALALVAVTTTVATLHVSYWRLGMAVSIAATAILAFAVYSISSSLRAAAKEQLLFAGVIIWAYVWLQISMLLIRAAGYRVVVRA